MKKLLLAVLFFAATAAGYGAAQLQMQIKMETVKTITNYAGAPIVRYDLGDTECFVANNAAMFCFKK